MPIFKRMHNCHVSSLIHGAGPKRADASGAGRSPLEHDERGLGVDKSYTAALAVPFD